MVAIAEAEKKDDGWYQCTAVNTVGSAATRARLQVVLPKEAPTTNVMPKLQIPYPGRVIVPEYDLFIIMFDCMIFSLDDDVLSKTTFNNQLYFN